MEDFKSSLYGNPFTEVLKGLIIDVLSSRRDDPFNNAQTPQAEAWGYWHDIPTGISAGRHFGQKQLHFPLTKPIWGIKVQF
jgi:hypothetical protein